MTLQAGATPIDMDAVIQAPPTPVVGSKSVFARLLDSVLSRPVTRVAVGWMFALAAVAVIAPLIANSHPYLLKTEGRWSSPLFKSLDYVDWTLMTGTLFAVVAWRIKSVRPVYRFVAVVGFVAVAAVALRFTVRTQENVDYSRFRRLDARHKAEFLLNAPIAYSASDRLIDQRAMTGQPPSGRHWMGTEANQADVASRIIHACRTAMSIGLVSTGIAICIGTFIGGLMGYFAGPIDLIGMRCIEMFEAIPTLILMITLVAFFPDESYRLPMLMTVIGATGWTGYARYLRAEMLRLRNMDFVHAAVASGLSTERIVFRHLLPNGVSPLLVAASFGVAGAIVSESTLSFLHLGTIDQPSWGGILTQSLGEGGEFHWWLAVFPGVAIFLTVLAYNRLGEAVADALDPKGG